MAATGGLHPTTAERHPVWRRRRRVAGEREASWTGGGGGADGVAGSPEMPVEVCALGTPLLDGYVEPDPALSLPKDTIEAEIGIGNTAGGGAAVKAGGGGGRSPGVSGRPATAAQLKLNQEDG
ncbi:hypothetical protein FKM82_004058 [Ascaphus truei]